MKNKVIIFGTGYVAERYYNRLQNMKDKYEVTYFLDSMGKKKEFHGKSVINPDELEKIEKNEYYYICGSDGSKNSMKNELLKKGVSESNIMVMENYSGENLYREIDDFKRVIVYPEITDLKIYNELNKKIQYYFSNIQDVEILYKIEDLKTDDVVLVWNHESLCELENMGILYSNGYKRVYCIDNSYYSGRDAHILTQLNYVKNKKYHSVSDKNLRKLEENGYDKAFVFGAGPSLSKGIEIWKNRFNDKNDLKIVCNHIYASAKFMELIKPNIYTLVDSLYIYPEGKEFLDGIIAYVVNNNCYLVVNEYWVPLLCEKNNKLAEHIIGLSMTAKDISIPKTGCREVYYKAVDVMTSLMLPIASALTDNIYISGCDGYPEKNENVQIIWEYDESIKNTARRFRQESEKVGLDTYVDYGFTYYNHTVYLKELIEKCEQEGKRYLTLTESYIPVFKNR